MTDWSEKDQDRRQGERRARDRRARPPGVVVREQLKILAALPFVDALLNAATDHALRSRLHGPAHWERVARNGIRIGYETGANLNAVLAFALIHDAFRENDDDDPLHGERAAAWAILNAELLGPGFNGYDRAALYSALDLHSDGLLGANVTSGTCFDADRLDLGRVGIRPDPDYFSTVAGRRLAGEL